MCRLGDSLLAGKENDSGNSPAERGQENGDRCDGQDRWRDSDAEGAKQDQPGEELAPGDGTNQTGRISHGVCAQKRLALRTSEYWVLSTEYSSEGLASIASSVW